MARAIDSVGIAGSGRVAKTLGRALLQAGFPLVAIASREARHARAAASFIGGQVIAVTVEELPRYASRVLIAVSDSAIGEVAALLAGSATPPRIVLHTSGAVGPEVLAMLADHGSSCGAIHPFQTIGDPTLHSSAVCAIAYSVSGDADALRWAGEIVTALNGTALYIAPQFRQLYHLAAVFSSNYITVLLDAASRLLIQAGVSEEDAMRAIGPIARTSVENALRMGPAQALTGPVSRGDAGTVQAHLITLAASGIAWEELYRAAARQALSLARERGLDDEACSRIEQALSQRQ